MERELIPKRLRQTLLGFWKKCAKYRYVGVVLLVGLVLLLWPEKKRTATTESPAAQEEPAEPREDLASQLKEVLAKIDGAGEVDVILTYETGAETFYQEQRTIQEDADGSRASEEQTVIVSQGSGQEAAVPVKVRYPTCRGALIVCDGADQASVRLAIKEAVRCLTGLGTDKISVVKRKRK